MKTLMPRDDIQWRLLPVRETGTAADKAGGRIASDD